MVCGRIALKIIDRLGWKHKHQVFAHESHEPAFSMWLISDQLPASLARQVREAVRILKKGEVVILKYKSDSIK